MPKVRASSGMIGTMRLPRSASRVNVESRRTKAIVVDTGRSPVPCSCCAKMDRAGVFTSRRDSTRLGMAPPSLARCRFR